MAVGSKRIYGLIMCSLVSSQLVLEAVCLDYGNYKFKNGDFVI